MQNPSHKFDPDDYNHFLHMSVLSFGLHCLLLPIVAPSKGCPASTASFFRLDSDHSSKIFVSPANFVAKSQLFAQRHSGNPLVSRVWIKSYLRYFPGEQCRRDVLEREIGDAANLDRRSGREKKLADRKLQGR